MKRTSLLITIFFLFSLVGCANMNKAQTGALGGAAGGALIGQIIGHNTEATLIGAAVGTMLGYIVGNEMDKYDREQLNHVYERGVPNQPSSWVNPNTHAQYTVTPKATYTDPRTNRICRPAEIQAVIDGKKETTYTTACRDENGHWQIQG